MAPIRDSLVLLLAMAAHVSCSNSSQYQPRPYTIDVDPRFIEETRLKVATFRSSNDIMEPQWSDGPPNSSIQALAQYWTNEYNWFEDQAAINKNFSLYTTTVPPSGNYDFDLEVYFIHQRSTRDDAIPLLMIHGWPSTSLEWEDVIPGLVAPDNDTEQAFHVVAPDLPGYGFSAAPVAPLTQQEYAAALVHVMDQLNYTRFAVYSTDLGFTVALNIVKEYTPRVINHITDFFFIAPNTTDLARYAAGNTTQDESHYIESYNAFVANHSAYAQLHATLPLSIAYALNDSPMGFLAWVYQLDFTVSSKAFTMARLIRQTLVLYIPGVFGNIRSYKALFAAPQQLVQGFFPKTDVPTSVLQFGGTDDYPALTWSELSPQSWIERHVNLTFFRRHPTGGHFPAEVEPQLVLDGVRAIFAT